MLFKIGVPLGQSEQMKGRNQAMLYNKIRRDVHFKNRETISLISGWVETPQKS